MRLVLGNSYLYTYVPSIVNTKYRHTLYSQITVHTRLSILPKKFHLNALIRVLHGEKVERLKYSIASLESLLVAYAAILAILVYDC